MECLQRRVEEVRDAYHCVKANMSADLSQISDFNTPGVTALLNLLGVELTTSQLQSTHRVVRSRPDHDAEKRLDVAARKPS